ncbi:MAG: chromosome partitioning protein ParB, partial [Lachnospiraceae bacterium]|nr:chromosome partitioning protein ParB [Lachnospiraceae bacterium]
DQELAEQIGSSRNQVQRYVRLTMLIPALLKLVDEKKIPFTLGVEISYLDTQIQGWILEHVSRKGTIKQAQIAELRRGAETDSLNHDEVIQILGNAVGNHTKKKDLMIPAKTVLKYFGADVSEEKALETIITLLKKWRERSNEGETGTD